MLLPPHPVDLFVLPLHLSDGLVLSGVELDCRGCGRSYRLTSGEGRAGLNGAKVALAARSACPRCGTQARFLVLVDVHQRRAKVQRVSRLGLWLAQGMMKLGRRSAVERVPMRDLAPPAPRPAPVVRRAEDALGQFGGTPIPAWIEVDGRRCHYVGLVPHHPNGLPKIGRNEFVIEPGLLYRQALAELV